MANQFFTSKGFQSSGFFNLTPKEAFHEATLNNAIIIDVRDNSLVGYKQFDVPNIIYLPFSQLEQYFLELPRNKLLIFADSVGLRSRESMIFLLNKGFTNIANLAGGIVEWEKDGFPLKIDKNETLTGSCLCRLRPTNKIVR